MITQIFPKDFQRYLSLPVLGPFMDSFAAWLQDRRYNLSTISQLLGHASPNTTNRYASIDLEMKREAIAKVKPIRGSGKPSWHKNQTVLEWLEHL